MTDISTVANAMFALFGEMRISPEHALAALGAAMAITITTQTNDRDLADQTRAAIDECLRKNLDLFEDLGVLASCQGTRH